MTATIVAGLTSASSPVLTAVLTNPMTPTGPAAARLVGVGVIVASTAAEAVGQLAFKRSTDHARPGANPIATAFAHWPWLVVGFAGFALDGLLWSAALRLLDVTVAHPIGSLVFVVTAVLSRVLLRERIPPRRWAGISLILAGSVLVALN